MVALAQTPTVDTRTVAGVFHDCESLSDLVPPVAAKVYGAHRKPNGIITLKCHALWRSIWMHPLAGPFKPPIDLTVYTHYLISVPTPMCLHDIHNKLMIGEYAARCVTWAWVIILCEEFHAVAIVVITHSYALTSQPYMSAHACI